MTCLKVIATLLPLALGIEESLKSLEFFSPGRSLRLNQETAEQVRRVRICDAYTSEDSDELHIKVGEELLTKDEALKYGTCQEFSVALKEGDTFRFDLKGHGEIGDFLVNAVPQSDAVLLLVIGRKSAEAMEPHFESHVFANLMNAQVAVIDLYKGVDTGSRVKIKDAIEVGDEERSEFLDFATVVAIGKGDYEVDLVDTKGVVVDAKKFVAENRESYVIFRSGMSDLKMPERVTVFPGMKGAAAALSVLSTLVAILFF